MADWNVPTLSSTYTDVLSILKARDVDAGTMFVSAPTNPVTGMIRYNRSTDLFEEYNGSAWATAPISIAGGGTGAATAADARTNLGLGTLATQNNNAVNITGGTISGLTSLGVSGNTTISGVATATTFSGSGASLTSIPNSATTAASANTASAIVARDGSGNFIAGTITAALNGNAATVTNGVVTTGSYGDPSWITSLAATKLSGTIADARLSSNVPLKNGTNVFTGTISGYGHAVQKAYRSTNLSLTSGVESPLTVDTTVFNVAGPLGNVIALSDTNCFTVGNGGTNNSYIVTAQVTFLAGGGTIRKVVLYQNGVAIARAETAPSTSAPIVLRLTEIVHSGVYPTYTVGVYQDSGGALNVYGAGVDNTYLEAARLW